MAHLPEAERRRRLGVRHRLAPGTRDDDVAAAAASVVALHGTDPASTFLSAWWRTEGVDIAGIEQAFYDERTVVRVLAMRRTVFAAPVAEVPALLAGAGDDVAREERRKLRPLLEAAGIAEPDAWIDEVERIALGHVDAAGEITSSELAALDERLARPVELGAGTANAASQKVASRLLTILSAEGKVVRTRPRGSWTSSQFRWSTMARWAPAAAELPTSEQAEAALAALWLARFGPAPADDLTWWCKWTKTRTRRALAAAGAVEVELDSGPGVALPDDLGLTPEVEPWGALLPALDPTTMGWKQRGWYLGDHAPMLFDVNGNAGPTLWWDGRVVGGWAHLPSGEIAMRLLDDVGAAARQQLDDQAERLTALLGDVRLTARARGYSPLEKQLLGRTTGRA